MLVDVVQLRSKGEKLLREEVRSATPVRGMLSLSRARPGWYPGKHNPPLLAGLVAPGQTNWALEPLDLARVVVIRDFQIIIAGVQEFNPSKYYRDRVKSFPQAWWCRVVHEGVTAAGVQQHYSTSVGAQMRPAPPVEANYRRRRHFSVSALGHGLISGRIGSPLAATT